ncbi:MAG: hypothetical protein IPM50_05005 [Acidobacteriota bacterium]|nr:MAG: hypothetical protein IPM50_05005 [Acidobacteriota bacterium]
MGLQKQLDESGYTQAAKELEEAKAALALAKANLSAGIMPNIPLTQFLADLAEMEVGLSKMEKALADEYAAAVKRVDGANDLDFTMLDVEERAEMVLEYVEKELPNHPNTPKIRELVEKN